MQKIILTTGHEIHAVDIKEVPHETDPAVEVRRSDTGIEIIPKFLIADIKPMRNMSWKVSLYYYDKIPKYRYIQAGDRDEAVAKARKFFNPYSNCREFAVERINSKDVPNGKYDEARLIV